jgi:DnaJ family protein C protein 28
MVRMVPLSNPASTLEGLTPESASKLRDVEWERQEEKFHDAAIREANDAIRRYNTVAPYIVRRPLLTRQSELERCYIQAADRIVAGIQARMAEGKHVQGDDTVLVPRQPSSDVRWDLPRLLSNAVKRLYTRFSSVVGRRMY